MTAGSTLSSLLVTRFSWNALSRTDSNSAPQAVTPEQCLYELTRLRDVFAALLAEPAGATGRETTANDPNANGGYSFLPPGAVGARAALAASDTGALVWAGSATAWNPVADTVEAAYLSGIRAAREAREARCSEV
jgi:hypothetical protein